MRRLRPVEERSDGVYADTAVLDETTADGAAVKRAVSFRAWEGPLLWDARHKEPEKLWLGSRPDDMRSIAATIVTSPRVGKQRSGGPSARGIYSEASRAARRRAA